MEEKIDLILEQQRSIFNLLNSLIEKNGKYNVEEVREKHKNAFKKWTEELDNELIEMYNNGSCENQIAKEMGRTEKSIHLRLQKIYPNIYCQWIGTEDIELKKHIELKTTMSTLMQQFKRPKTQINDRIKLLI